MQLQLTLTSAGSENIGPRVKKLGWNDKIRPRGHSCPALMLRGNRTACDFSRINFAV
jgi:hypothetical protein